MTKRATPDIDPKDIVLFRGGHAAGSNELCFNEWAAKLAGEPHSASPKCVPPTLQRFTMRLNDHWNDEDRQQLVPYLFKVMGAPNTAAAEMERGYMMLDWAREQVRQHLERIAAIDASAASAALKYGSADYQTVRGAVYKAVRTKVEEAVRERHSETVVAIQRSALALLDSLIDCGSVAA